jgi:hypothetical protein
MRYITSVFIVLLVASMGQTQQTILQQPTLPATSVDSPADTGQVWALVDDNVVSPAKTNKVALQTIVQLGKYYLKPTGVIGSVDDVNLTGAEPDVILVDSIDEKDNLVVPANMSCMLVNVSETGESIDISTVGNNQITLAVNDWCWITWSATHAGGAQHIISRPAGSIVDTSMSATSNNPVRNSTIKTYVDGLSYLTIDSAMSGTSNNAVRNSTIKTYVDNRALVRPSDVIVTASGNAATDTSALIAAATALDTVGYGTLWIDGNVQINSQVTLHAPISLKGLNSNAGITWTNAAGRIQWQPVGTNDFNPPTTSSITGSAAATGFTATTAKQTFVLSETLELADGDWFIVYSDDPIPNHKPHSTANYPAEVHSVLRRDTATVVATAPGTVTANVDNNLTWVGNTLANNDRVRFTSTGTLPAPLSAATRYYVVQKSGNSFKVSLSSGGAEVDITDTGTGTHTAYTDEFTETVSSGKTTGTFGDIKNSWPVKLSTTGTLPAPLVAGTRYYAVEYDSGKQWKLATTPGGTPIQITDVGSGTHTLIADAYRLGDFIVDALTTNQKIRRLPILAQPGSANVSNVEVCNLTLRSADRSVNNYTSLYFTCLNGVHVHDVVWELNGTAGGPGYMGFNYCANVEVDHCALHGTDDYDDETKSAYGVVFRGINGATCHDCIFKRARHVVDVSLAFDDTGDANLRYGTPRNILIHNNIVEFDQHEDGTIAFSTHAEGWGVTFANNVFFLAEDSGSSTNTTGGILIRSRAAKVQGNVFHGPGPAANVSIRCLQIAASDCVVQGNFFDGIAHAVAVDYSDTAGRCNRNLVVNNVFTNCGATVTANGIVKVTGGADHVISGNQFIKPAGTSVNLVNGSATPNLTNCRITNNEIHDQDGTANTAAILLAGTGAASLENVRIVGNVFDSVQEICIRVAGGASGVGDNIWIVGNCFRDCTASDIIEFVDDGTTTGHRVANNDAPKMSNTNFMDVGALATAAIKIRGNTVDGYGAGSLGLTGTNAAAITTAQAAKNWTD